jgi:hypothetical protein
MLTVMEADTQWLKIPLEQPGTHGNYSLATPVIKREITEWLFKESDGVVQTGPFAGMKVLNETAWKSTYLAPVLLGCYEQELHGEIERQITRLSKLENPTIGVVGCAEGYYAVGFKQRIPKATVYIIDIDSQCLEVCGHNAAANSVQLVAKAPVHVVLDCDLIFMDVEGAETDYLDPVKFPGLRDRHLIVEIHDLGPRHPVTEILLDRFRGSHRIQYLFTGTRNPSEYKWLCAMHQDYQWLAMSEGRMSMMGWFVMYPKGEALS